MRVVHRDHGVSTAAAGGQRLDHAADQLQRAVVAAGRPLRERAQRNRLGALGSCCPAYGRAGHGGGCRGLASQPSFADTGAPVDSHPAGFAPIGKCLGDQTKFLVSAG
jgi:hypothetical protein